MARFTTLYSGSSGNCACIEENGKYLLVDVGKNCKTTMLALKALGLTIEDLGGILITHEHSDHVSGLKVFLKKAKVPVYGAAATLDYLLEYGLVPSDTQLIEIDGRQEDICGFSVQSFETSHDSVACRGYRITSAGGKVLSLATDLGFVSDEVIANLYMSDLVCLEANYDRHLLMTGIYPYYLKKRIDSNRGHLCNEETGQTVSMLIANGCKKIALCHLSSENNNAELALSAVKKALLANNIVPAEDCIVKTLKRHDVSDWMEL